MGRHAAPDEPEPPAGAAATDSTTTDTAPTGTAPTDTATTDTATTYVGSHARPEPPPLRGTRADLHLLRTRPGVRWAVLAVLVLAFAVYTAIIVVLGHGDRYALWIWIPIVVSGVGVGAVLDVAHKRSADD